MHVYISDNGFTLQMSRPVSQACLQTFRFTIQQPRVPQRCSLNVRVASYAPCSLGARVWGRPHAHVHKCNAERRYLRQPRAGKQGKLSETKSEALKESRG